VASFQCRASVPLANERAPQVPKAFEAARFTFLKQAPAKINHPLIKGYIYHYMIYLPKSVRVESDGISGAGAFVGNLLLEGFYAIERRSTLATVLLALMDCFEVAGGEITDSLQCGFYGSRQTASRLEVFMEELFFAVIGERQEFYFPGEATQGCFVEIIQ